MRCLVHSLIAFFFVSARTTDMDSAEPENRRFNVLFIAIDDLNKWALGLSDHSAARTPHMERLAKRGVVFSNLPESSTMRTRDH